MRAAMMTLLLVLAAFPARADCLRADGVTGRLAIARAAHPTQGAFTALQLRVDGACVDLASGRVTPRFIHLDPADNAAKHALRESIGYRVTVRGREFGAPGTAWHTGDIVLLGARLVRRER